MTTTPARQRNYYCTAKQQAIITKRAKAAGMSRSAFMVACALHEEPVGAELMPTADEQESLLDRLSATAEVATRLMATGWRHNSEDTWRHLGHLIGTIKPGKCRQLHPKFMHDTSLIA